MFHLILVNFPQKAIGLSLLCCTASEILFISLPPVDVDLGREPRPKQMSTQNAYLVKNILFYFPWCHYHFLSDLCYHDFSSLTVQHSTTHLPSV